jgi:hypothetical protein
VSVNWLGIQRRTSPIDPRPAADFAVNNNYTVAGEIRRRMGKAATNVPKQAGAVLNIAPPIGPSGGIIVFPTGGTIEGYQDPLSLWDDTKAPIAVDSAWAFPQQAPPAAWALPVGHQNGFVHVFATSSIPTFPIPEGATFSVYFDGVLTFVSLCLTNGGQSFAIPPGVAHVNVTSVTGCGPGGDPTGAITWAEGT